MAFAAKPATEGETGSASTVQSRYALPVYSYILAILPLLTIPYRCVRSVR